ncbi:MAG: 2TM domain-containing protein [Thermomicrobiales bacterium]
MVDPSDPRFQRAKDQVDRLSGFYKSLGAFVVVGIILFAINAYTGSPWWFFWPLIFWGIGLGVQAFGVFGPGARIGQDWQNRKVQEYMDKDQG